MYFKDISFQIWILTDYTNTRMVDAIILIVLANDNTDIQYICCWEQRTNFNWFYVFKKMTFVADFETYPLETVVYIYCCFHILSRNQCGCVWVSWDMLLMSDNGRQTVGFVLSWICWQEE